MYLYLGRSDAAPSCRRSSNGRNAVALNRSCNDRLSRVDQISTAQRSDKNARYATELVCVYVCVYVKYVNVYVK